MVDFISRLVPGILKMDSFILFLKSVEALGWSQMNTMVPMSCSFTSVILRALIMNDKISKIEMILASRRVLNAAAR